MNYRHHFHAGNFADVFKHSALLQLVAGMQRKEKGFLYLDTHAGRGRYDLAAAAMGDSLARKPEWPDGIGRLWNKTDLSPQLQSYLAAVKSFAAAHGGGAKAQSATMYPGSPWLVRTVLRPQDRMALCELHPEEAALLIKGFRRVPRATVQVLDGYTAVRAMLPPPERRALVLIDPPFEDQEEYASILAALEHGLRRLPSATFAVWYPLTSRARLDTFVEELAALPPPPCFLLELSVAGSTSALKMRGCGLAVINPPWQIAPVLEGMTHDLAALLAQEPGGEGSLRWIVPE